MQKFAAVGETVGLSYEYAAAALATVTATTRESADTVGTAFRTLFSRIEGLQLGETLDDGTTLNKYSKALEKVGISIKDLSTGDMKSMNDILDELGAKWQTLDQATQTALAETIGGVRQYTQLMALMNNWDFFKENVSRAEGADGALQAQADIYAESWEAARDRVKASAESIYQDLIDDEFFIKLNNGFADLLSGIDKFIDGFGGLKSVILSVGAIVLGMVSNKIGPAIQKTVQDIQILTGGSDEVYSKMQADFNQLTDQEINSGNYTAAQKAELRGSQALLLAKTKYGAVSEQLSDQERMRVELAIQGLQLQAENYKKLAEERVAAEKEVQSNIKATTQMQQELDKANEEALKQLQDKQTKINNRATKAGINFYQSRKYIEEAVFEDEANIRLSGNARARARDRGILNDAEIDGYIDQVNILGQRIRDKLLTSLTFDFDSNDFSQLIEDNDLFNVTDADQLNQAQEKLTMLQESFGPLINSSEKLRTAFRDAINADSVESYNHFIVNLYEQLENASIPANRVASILKGLGVNQEAVNNYTKALANLQKVTEEAAQAQAELDSFINNNQSRQTAVNNLVSAQNELVQATEKQTQAEEELKNITDPAQRIAAEQKVAQAKQAVVDATEKIKQAEEELKNAGATDTQVAAANKLAKAKADEAAATRALNEARQQENKANKDLNKNAEELNVSHTVTGIQAITSAASALGQSAMVINSIKSMFTTLGDATTAAGEKITATFMGISMAVSGAIGVYKNFATAIEFINEQQVLQNAITKANTELTVLSSLAQNKIGISQKAGAAILALKTTGLNVDTVAQQANIIAEETGISTKYAMIIAIELQEGATVEEAFATAQNTAIKEKQDLVEKESLITKAKLWIAEQKHAKTLWASLGPYIAIVAVIGALVAISIAAYKAQHAHEEQMKRSAEAAESLKQKSEDAAQKVEDIKSAFDSYDSAVEALQNCTKGTEEWYNALSKVNDEILNILANDVNLASQLNISRNNEGMLQIDNQQDILDSYELQAKNAKYAALLGNIDYLESKQVANTIDAINQNAPPDSAKYTLSDYENDLTLNTDRGNGEEITEIFKNAIDYVGLTKDELKNQLINKYNYDPEDNGWKYLEDETAFDNFYNSLQDLGKEAQQVADAMDNAARIIVDEELGDTYDAITKDITSKAYQQKINDIEKTIEAEGKQLSWASGSKAAEDLWERYKKATGTNFVLTSNAVKGGDNNRTFEYLDNGERKEISLKEMASAIAASEALADLGNTAQETSTVLSTLRTNTQEQFKGERGKSISTGLNNWIATGNFDSIGSLDFDELKKIDDPTAFLMKELGADNAEEFDEQAKKLGRETGEALVKEFIKAIENYSKGAQQLEQQLRTIGKKIDLNDIGLNFSESNLGLNTKQKIADMLDQAFQGQGARVSSSLATLFAKAGDNVGDLIDIFDNVDWLNFNSIIEAEEAARDLGIDINGKAWIEYTNAMKASARTAENFINSLDSLREALKSINDLSKDIKFGSIIKDEDYEALLKYNKQIASLFTMTADGYKFIGNDIDDLTQRLGNGYSDLGEIKTQFDLANEAGEFVNNNSAIDFVSGVYKNSGTAMTDVNKADEVWSLLQDEKNSGYIDTILNNAEISRDELEYLANSARNSITGAIKFNRLEEGDLNKFLKVFDEAGKMQQGFIDGIYSSQAAEEIWVNSSIDSISRLNGAYSSGEISAQTYQKTLESVARTEAEKYGLDFETVKTQAELMSNSLDISAESSYQLVMANERMNNGITSLKSNWSNWSKVLKNSDKTSSEYAETINEVRECVADLVGFAKKDLIPAKFFENADNLDLISKAAKGNADAITQLGAAAASASIAELQLSDAASETLNKLDKNEFDPSIDWDLGQAAVRFKTLKDTVISGIETISNAADGMTLEEAFDGADMTAEEWISSLNAMATATGMSVADMNSYLNSMGVQADVTTTKQTVHTSVPVYRTTEEIDASGLDQSTGSGTVVTTSHTQVIDYEPVDETIEVAQVNMGDNAGTKPTIHRASGGGVNKNSGGGGGGGKVTKKDSRYKNIDAKLSTSKNNLDKISESTDRAFGTAKISNFNKQLEETNNQISLLNQKLKEAENYLQKDIADLSQYGVSPIFDSNGTLLNYEEMADAIFAAYENDSEKYDKAMEALDQVVETHELIIDLKAEINDAELQRVDTELEKLNYEVEVGLKINEEDLKVIEYYLNKIEDDAFAAAERIALLGQKTANAIEKSNINSSGLQDLIAYINDPANEGLINYEDVADQVYNYRDALLETNQELVEMDKTVKDQLINTYEAFNEKIDAQIDKFEKYNSFIEHYKNIIDIVGRDNLGISDQTMKMLRSIQNENAITRLANETAHLKSLEASRNNTMSMLDQATTEEDRKYWEEQLEKIDADILDYKDQWMQDWEDALQGSMDAFKEAVEDATKNFEKAVSPLLGSVEELREQFDRAKEIDDLYVDDYEKIYELSKLNRDISKSMDETDSIKVKEELAKLQEEINQKQAEGIKLTKHDFEEMRKRYELKLAEAALDEAKNSKKTVMLVQDSEGNYDYVYTADEQAVADAEQTYEDKLFEYQQLNAEYIQSLQDLIIGVEEEITQRIQELDITKFASKEEYINAVNAIIEDAKTKEAVYFEELDETLNNQKVLYENDWMAYSKATNYRISSNQEWINNWDETALGMKTGYADIQSYQEALNAALGSTEDIESGNEATLLGALAAAYDEWQANNERVFEAAGTSMDNFNITVQNDAADIGKSIAETGDAADDLAEKMKDGMAAVTDYIKTWKEQYAEAVGSIIEQNEALFATCQKLIDKLKETNNITLAVQAVNDEAEGGTGDSNAGIGESEEGAGGTPTYASFTPNTWYKVRSLGTSGWSYYKKSNASGTALMQPEVLSQDRTIRDDDWEKGLYYKSGGYTGTFTSARTGMYTGQWSGADLEENGRWALLHQKELVLNSDDTQNILSAVDIVRQLELLTKAQNYMSDLHSPSASSGMSGEINQDIVINADFPAVQSHFEIEQAFENLIGKASQYAGRK